MSPRKFRKDEPRHVKMQPYSRRVELFRIIVRHSNGMLPIERTPVYVWGSKGESRHG